MCLTVRGAPQEGNALLPKVSMLSYTEGTVPTDFKQHLLWLVAMEVGCNRSVMSPTACALLFRGAGDPFRMSSIMCISWASK